MRSLQTTRNAAYKAALLAGGAGIIALAQPAMAQQDNSTPPGPTTTSPTCNPANDPNCPAKTRAPRPKPRDSADFRSAYGWREPPLLPSCIGSPILHPAAG